MYFLAPDGLVYDDGAGEATAPAYAIGARGERRELPAPTARALTERFVRERGPGLGDLVARSTRALGIQPCPPCKRRQEYLNRLGARAGAFFYGEPKKES